MSIVRYDSDGLAVIHKNSESNALVVYDSDSNRFQLISLDGYKKASVAADRAPQVPHATPQRSYSTRPMFQEFVCPNCGYVGEMSADLGSHGVNQHKASGRSAGHNSRRASGSRDARAHNASRSRRRRSSADLNDSDSEDDRLVSGQRKRRRSISSSTSQDVPRLSDAAEYITTSSGDVLRGDYFRLLARINDSQATRDLIQQATAGLKFLEDSKGETPDGGLPSGAIPFELINQGYFDKFFHVLKVLGNGANGKVYKVEHELMGLNLGVFALKKVAIGDDVKNLVRILNEVKFLYDLSDNSYSTGEDGSSNVVHYNHVWLEVDQVSQFGPKVPVIFILYEYCDGGDLEKFVSSVANPEFDIEKEKRYRRMRKAGKLEEAAEYRQHSARHLNNYEIFKIFDDVLSGLGYLHKLRIIHRDLKPSNCLFKGKFSADYEPITSTAQFDRIPPLLVSDFGESIMENTRRNSTGTTGTLEFCAPELFEEDTSQSGHRLKEFSHSSDVYSLGMILYYLCFNDLPFKSDSPEQLRSEIIRYKMFQGMDRIRETSDRIDGDKLLSDWIDLIRQMVNQDVSSRPSASELKKQMKEIRKKLEAEDEKDKEDEDGSDEHYEAVTAADVLGPVLSPLAQPHLKEDTRRELLAIVSDKAKERQLQLYLDYSLVLLVMLTTTNLWFFAQRPLIVKLEYLALGLSLTPGTRTYLLALQAALLTGAVAQMLYESS